MFLRYKLFIALQFFITIYVPASYKPLHFWVFNDRVVFGKIYLHFLKRSFPVLIFVHGVVKLSLKNLNQEKELSKAYSFPPSECHIVTNAISERKLVLEIYFHKKMLKEDWIFCFNRMRKKSLLWTQFQKKFMILFHHLLTLS